MTGVTWTDERIARLIKLWAEGFSASQIAALLGHVSRNAVIGKVHRLGLASRKTTTTAVATRKHVAPSAEVARKSVPIRISHRPIVQGNVAVQHGLEDAEPVFTVQVMPMFPRVTLLELKPSSRKWPIGDPLSPQFRFCGAPAENGSPYCSYHACLAYQPRPGSNAARKTTGDQGHGAREAFR